MYIKRRTLETKLLILILISSATASVFAGAKTRLYDFENGTVGTPATTVTSSITGPFTGVPDAVFGQPSRFYDIGPDGVPGGTPLGDWVAGFYNPAPAATPLLGTPTYVNVSNGSPLDSPSTGSTVGLQFDGDDAVQGQSFRGYFMTVAGTTNNEPQSDSNTIQSFQVLSQAWVRPDGSFNGTEQTVWSVGNELGGIGITADGFWKHTALLGDDQVTSTPVAFDQWTHLAVRHTGGAATLFVNGTLALTTSTFYNNWQTFTTLGSYEDGTEPFKGVLDSFSTVGTAGLGIVTTPTPQQPVSDLDVFVDLNLPGPSGVTGDVDQDGDADQEDYDIWSTNSGFNNGLGLGDLTTLVKGDLDNNGKVNFFDFRVIAGAVAAAGGSLSLANNAVPEPSCGILLAIAGTATWWARVRRSRV